MSFALAAVDTPPPQPGPRISALRVDPDTSTRSRCRAREHTKLKEGRMHEVLVMFGPAQPAES